MRKAEVINERRKLNIMYDEGVNAKEAKILPQDWIRNNAKPALVLIARDCSHEVLFAPPYLKIYYRSS